MDDSTVTPQAGTGEPQAGQPQPSPTKPSNDIASLPEWAQDVIGKLRSEAAGYRKAKAEVEKQLQEIVGKQADVEAERQTWRAAQERLERLEKAVEGVLQAEVADVPERLRDLVPKLAPEEQLLWLRQARAAGLWRRTTPQTDHQEGAGALRGINEAERAALAVALGINPKYLPKE